MNSLFPALPQSLPATPSPPSASTFSQTGSESFSQALSTQGQEDTGTLKQMAYEVAVKNGIPPNVFQALVTVESGWNPNAVSSAGAMGLTQLMPGTARGLSVTNAFDPAAALEGGARYLADQLKAFDGNVAFALAAYNAGPAAVKEWGGVPPYPQTQAYVQKILALAQNL